MVKRSGTKYTEEIKTNKSRKATIILSVALCAIGVLALLRALNNKDSDTARTNNVSVVESYYTIQEDNTDDMGALFFLGYGDKEKDKNLTRLLEDCGLESILTIDTDIDTIIRQEDCEWYLIIPKYKDTTITIQDVALEEDGELLPKGEVIKSYKPVLLCCNFSDIVPSTQVTVEYQGKQIIFNPQISLKDGDVASVQGIYTKSYGN